MRCGIIRRLVFNALIGNADMHLKNWSLILLDRRTATLSPAYDFVSTIAFLPDDRLTLNVSRTQKFAEFSVGEIAHLAAKARLPQKPALDAAMETMGDVSPHGGPTEGRGRNGPVVTIILAERRL